MVTGRGNADQLKPISFDSIIFIINGSLQELHDVLVKAFASDSKLLQVFEEVWGALSRFDGLQIDKVEEIDNFYSSFIKNIEQHIDLFCDHFNIVRAEVPANTVAMLTQISKVYYQSVRFKFLLNHQLQPNLLNQLKYEAKRLSANCDGVEAIAKKINLAEIIKVNNLYRQFLYLIATEFANKHYVIFKIDAPDVKINFEKLNELRDKLKTLPEISELNTIIDRYNESIKTPAEKQYENELKTAIATVKNIYNLINKSDKEMLYAIGLLDEMLKSARLLNDKLKEFSNLDHFASSYKYILEVTDQSKESAFNAAINDAINVSDNQSIVEKYTIGLYSRGWGAVKEKLKEMSSRVSNAMKSDAESYFEIRKEMSSLLARIKALKCLHAEVERERTTMGKSFDDADKVIGGVLTKLQETEITLRDHFHVDETIKGFIKRHWGKVTLGGTGGVGSGLALGFFALQPEFIPLAAIGAGAFGSAAGIGAGLWVDHKKEKEIHPPQTPVAKLR